MTAEIPWSVILHSAGADQYKMPPMVQMAISM